MSEGGYGGFKFITDPGGRPCLIKIDTNEKNTNETIKTFGDDTRKEIMSELNKMAGGNKKRRSRRKSKKSRKGKSRKSNRRR